jgi:hypothetical protein
MAHYAFLNDDDIVTEVIVGRDEDDFVDGVTSWETYYGNIRGQTCLRTSYNTYRDENGVPQHTNGGTPFRGQYAGIGDLWNGTEFTTPQLDPVD